MITEQQDKALQELGYTGDVAMDIDKAIRWLREVKGVHVCVKPLTPSMKVWTCSVYHKDIESLTEYPAHDLAQSAGLDAAIDYLKKQQI